MPNNAEISRAFFKMLSARFELFPDTRFAAARAEGIMVVVARKGAGQEADLEDLVSRWRGVIQEAPLGAESAPKPSETE